MEKKHKFSLWYALIGIWIVLIIQSYLSALFSIEVIPYSQFLSLLKSGKIIEVAVSANQIQGKMKLDNEEIKPFRTIRVDPEFSAMLEKYPVVFKGEVESPFSVNYCHGYFPFSSSSAFGI